MATASSVSRRTVASGLAWTVPTVMVSTAAPAFAASTCSTSARISGGPAAYWAPGGDCSALNMDFGAQTYVCGLPSGVTVTRVDYKFWIQRREGQDSTGSGIYYLGNTTSNYSGVPQTNASIKWSPASAGWRNTVIANNSTGARTFKSPNGTTVNATNTWTIEMAWSATAGAGTYTQSSVSGNNTVFCPATSTNCQNFTTGPSGRFAVQYKGLTRYAPGQAFVFSGMDVKVTLSNNKTIAWSTNDNANVPDGTEPGSCY